MVTTSNQVRTGAMLQPFINYTVLSGDLPCKDLQLCGNSVTFCNKMSGCIGMDKKECTYISLSRILIALAQVL